MMSKDDMEHEVAQAVADLKNVWQQLRRARALYLDSDREGEIDPYVVGDLDWSIRTVAALLDLWERR